MPLPCSHFHVHTSSSRTFIQPAHLSPVVAEEHSVWVQHGHHHKRDGGTEHRCPRVGAQQEGQEALKGGGEGEKKEAGMAGRRRSGTSGRQGSSEGKKGGRAFGRFWGLGVWGVRRPRGNEREWYPGRGWPGKGGTGSLQPRMASPASRSWPVSPPGAPAP